MTDLVAMLMEITIFEKEVRYYWFSTIGLGLHCSTFLPGMYTIKSSLLL
jgi:hypothetical protein